MKPARFNKTLLGGALAASLIVSVNLAAQAVKPAINPIVVEESATLVSFAGGTAKSGGYIHVRIDGPSGAKVFEARSESGLVDWVLPSDLPDGYYRYDVWFTPQVADPRGLHANPGGMPAAGKGDPSPRPAYHAGVLVIEAGLLVPQVNTGERGDRNLSMQRSEPGLFERLAAGVLEVVVPTAAAADLVGEHVILDDSVPFISLDDTDNGTTIPDWNILGYADQFAVAGGGSFQFAIDKDAPTNSLFIEGVTGRIGMGTSTPDSSLHITDSSASIRLENIASGFEQLWTMGMPGASFGNSTTAWKLQDSSNCTSPPPPFPPNCPAPVGVESGAPGASLWIDAGGAIGMGTANPVGSLDIANADPDLTLTDTDGTRYVLQNEGGVFFLENQGNFTSPLEIYGNAPENALVLTAQGAGFGTDNTPDASLHVARNTGAQLRVENKGTGDGTNDIMFRLTNASADIIRFVMKNSTSSWTFDNAGNLFRIALVGGSTTPEFTVDNNGDGHFRGDVYANGIKLTSSRTLKTGFTPVDEATLLAKVAALDISQWHYKSEPATAQHIGPMAEQFQAVFELGDGKHLEMVDTTGIAFAAIQALEAENAALQAKNAELETRLAAIEAQLVAQDQ